jgi:hypothetical protein
MSDGPLTFPETKDPAETRDFGLSWKAVMEAIRLGDAIATSDWSVPSPLVRVSQAAGAQITTVRISGGIAMQDYILVNTITTASGQTLRRSCIVMVRPR